MEIDQVLIGTEQLSLRQRLSQDKIKWMKLDSSIVLGPSYYMMLRDLYRQQVQIKDKLKIDRNLPENEKDFNPAFMKALAACEPPRPNRGILMQFLNIVKTVTQTYPALINSGIFGSCFRRFLGTSSEVPRRFFAGMSELPRRFVRGSSGIPRRLAGSSSVILRRFGGSPGVPRRFLVLCCGPNFF